MSTGNSIETFGEKNNLWHPGLRSLRAGQRGNRV